MMERRVIPYPAWHDEARRLKASGKTLSEVADHFSISVARASQITSPNWKNYLVIHNRTTGKRGAVSSVDVNNYTFVMDETALVREKDKSKQIFRRRELEDELSKERLFPTTKKFDNGMIYVGATIKCSKCDKHADYFKGSGSITPNYAAKEFGRMGWIVGGSHRADLCPACAASLRSKPVLKDFAQIQTVKDEPVTVTLVPPVEVKPVGIETIVQPAAPAELDKTSRRLILSKLNDVYEDETLGYRDDWTDAKVATDLGVPVEWIKELRDDNFGPETNAAMRAAVVSSVTADAEALNRLIVLIDKKLEQMGELDAKVSASIEECEKHVAAIDKAVDRFEELKASLAVSDAKMKEVTDQFAVQVEDFKKKYADLKRSPFAA